MIAAAHRALGAALALLAIAWALGLHRRLGLLVYPEQFLALALGLALGASFLRTDAAGRPRWPIDPALAALGLVPCAVLALDYPARLDAAIYQPASALPLALDLRFRGRERADDRRGGAPVRAARDGAEAAGPAPRGDGGGGVRRGRSRRARSRQASGPRPRGSIV